MNKALINRFEIISNIPLPSCRLTFCILLMLVLHLSTSLQAEQTTQLLRPSKMTPLAQEGMLIDIARSQGRMVIVGERGHILYADDLDDDLDANGDGISNSMGDQRLRWRQAEVPTQNLLTAITLVGTKGWAVGHDGMILFSDDHAVSWQIQRFAPFDATNNDDGRAGVPLLDLHFLDEVRGFAVGAYGYFLGTLDGGQTWQDLSNTIDNLDGFHLNSINQTPQGVLFIVGEMGTLFRSTDQGQHWTRLPAPYEGSLFGSELSLAPEKIYCYGLAGRLFQSDDLGAHWQQVAVPNGSNTIMASAFSSGGLIFAGNGGLIFMLDPITGALSVEHRSDRQSIMGVGPIEQGLVLVGKNGVNYHGF